MRMELYKIDVRRGDRNYTAFVALLDMAAMSLPDPTSIVICKHTFAGSQPALPPEKAIAGGGYPMLELTSAGYDPDRGAAVRLAVQRLPRARWARSDPTGRNWCSP